MLKLKLPEMEVFDTQKNEFVDLPSATLRLEHSLASVSKWESIHKKAFLSSKQKTLEETTSYIECMSLGKTPKNLRSRLSNDIVSRINEYISTPITATTFAEPKTGSRSSEVVTAEVIYYWLVSLQVPMECEKWHLDKLLTLLRVISIKNAPNNKKMSKSETIMRNRQLNAQRRAALNTTG